MLNIARYTDYKRDFEVADQDGIEDRCCAHLLSQPHQKQKTNHPNNTCHRRYYHIRKAKLNKAGSKTESSKK